MLVSFGRLVQVVTDLHSHYVKERKRTDGNLSPKLQHYVFKFVMCLCFAVVFDFQFVVFDNLNEPSVFSLLRLPFFSRSFFFFSTFFRSVFSAFSFFYFLCHDRKRSCCFLDRVGLGS